MDPLVDVSENPFLRGRRPFWLETRRHYAEPPGTRPPLATAAGVIYAIAGVALAGLTVASIFRGEGWRSVVFVAPLVVYCAGLAYGALRLRRPSPRGRGLGWSCVPILAHALVGLAGSLGFLAAAFGLRELRSAGEFTSSAAMLGMLVGPALAIVPRLSLRRGAVWLTAAVAGPLLLAAMIHFVL